MFCPFCYPRCHFTNPTIFSNEIKFLAVSNLCIPVFHSSVPFLDSLLGFVCSSLPKQINHSQGLQSRLQQRLHSQISFFVALCVAFFPLSKNNVLENYAGLGTDNTFCTSILVFIIDKRPSSYLLVFLVTLYVDTNLVYWPFKGNNAKAIGLYVVIFDVVHVGNW